MKNFHAFAIFSAISLILLLVEISVLRHSTIQQSWFGPQDYRLICQSNVRIISKLASKHQIPIFPVDQDVLLKLGNYSAIDDFSSLFCFQKVLSFATFNKFFGYKPKFFEDIKQIGFEIVTIEGLNRRLLQHGYRVIIPLHYIFIRWGHTLQVTIIYERETGFWWNGALTFNQTVLSFLQSWNLQTSDFTFGKHEYAFNRFEVTSVKVFGLLFHIPSTIPSFLKQVKQAKFIECNRTRAQLFHEKYGQEESTEALEFKSDAWHLLAKTKNLLDDLSVRFWLSSGTCLGYFRQCDIIPYSKDVDIGIWIKDYKPQIIPTLSSHGLPLRHMFGRVNDSFELSFQNDDVKLDIFFFYEEKDHMWNGGTQARTGKKFKYVFPIFTLCWTEFLELKVRIPCETEDYIKANYGSNWFQPVRTWDWKKSPPNVRENGQWPEEDWPQVIQMFRPPGS